MAQDDTDLTTRLLAAIDRGELRPGERLTESELAARFGVSRTPVREALGRLESQGVVARDPRRGLVIARLDYDQLGELYDLREVVEGLAARLAARRAAPAEIAVLREMVEADRARADDPGALAASNRLFHRQLHRASHNRYLIQMLESVRRASALLSGTTLAVPGRGARSVEEHDAIVRAIEARDEVDAEAAARAHIAEAHRARVRVEAGG